MISKARQRVKDAGTLEVFPDFLPRDDMQNSIYLDRPAHQAALEGHLGNNETTIVLSEIPVRWTPSQQRGHRIPDLLVAFGVDREQAEAQNGYSIRDLGKPPDCVLEVASVRTADNDVTGKRVDYANFGIPEYWRFDPTGGQRYDTPLAGDRLVEGAYQPVEIVEVEPEHLHGHSEVLNLDPCWDHGQLRWYDPVARQHLLTFVEEREGRISAESRANSAEARVRELEEELQRRQQG
jgi:Uma2 family endonuclease